MRLARFLFKPKWQDKDVAVRRSAVASSDDPELIAALPRLVREDGDAAVRLAALKRLNDYENWRERSTADPERVVRDNARNTYLALLCAATREPPLARRIAELDTLSADELERVATSSIDRELRKVALAQVKRPALLVERALGDPDADLRQAALDRIADPALLERVAEKARKTDKNIARRAREKLETLRIAAGDSVTIADKARLACERVEALMRRPGEGLTAELETIDAEWKALGAALPDDLSARYQGARAIAFKALERLNAPPKPAEPPSQETLPTADVSAETPADAGSVPTEAAAADQPTPASAIEDAGIALASRARFDAALAAAQTQARAERERQRARQRAVAESLPVLSAAIDAGNAGEAHRLHAQLEKQLKQLDDVPAEVQRELAPLLARYAELTRWQHWSNNQRRRVLCADIEALAGAGLHPDAVATRVREAREEWQRMNGAEGIEADANGGLGRRFQALCQQALRPTKQYFSKRQEVRETHAGQIATLLERIAAIGSESTDWRAIANLRGEASVALRGLDAVPPQTRTALAKQLKDAIARLHELGAAHERAVEQDKRRLIEKARALSGRDANDAGAMRDARDLQKEWTALGNGRRGTDQQQWRDFRAALDAVFNRADEARKERETQAVQRSGEALQLVERYEQLAQSTALPADALKTALRELDAAWQTAAPEQRELQRRQREARQAISDLIKDDARRQRLAPYRHALDAYRRLRRGEAASDDGNVAASGAFDAALAQRAAARERAPEEAQHARDWLVQLEFLAGRESPAEDRQRRLNFQVGRLSSHLRGERDTAARQRELDELLAAWFALAPQPDALEQRFEEAATAALDTLS